MHASSPRPSSAPAADADVAQPRLIKWRSADRRYLPILAILVFALAATITLLYVVFEFSHVEGDSMLPALQHNDRLLVTRGYDAPQRGDIVAFDATDQDGQRVSLIKRVIGIPGDSIEMVGDSAYVNGEPSSVAPGALIGTDSRTLGPLTVPEGTVFVLGDNRPISLDSRFIGAIPLSSITGRAHSIVLPLSRFGRIDVTSDGS